MKTINNLNFDTSIRVLFKVKEAKGHKTLNETYAYVGNKEDIDAMITVALISYNLANNTQLNEDQFQEILAKEGIGLIKMITIFGEVIEAIMFDGTTDEERKNIMALVEKQSKK